MTTLTHDIAAICHAIDADHDGTDDAWNLMALADALEEAGLPRQLVSVWDESQGWHMAYRPFEPATVSGESYSWNRGPTFGGHVSLDYLPPEVFDRLGLDDEVENDAWMMADRKPTRRAYPTLSAAYLALAEALAKS